ncbi:hypothetical protein Tco_0537314 [Tanacetum coccineum]|uniref:Uncharacterized protein n=1 Tax=Tanacetum coccineum TaxID=301880 RepID=A0ABQ4Y922_9ASTR
MFRWMSVSASQNGHKCPVCGSTICSGGGDTGNGDDTGRGGDSICGSGDEYDVSCDGGRVDMARNLSTSTADGNGIVSDTR